MKFDETLLADSQVAGSANNEAITGTLDGLDQSGRIYFRPDGEIEARAVDLGLDVGDEAIVTATLSRARAVALRTADPSAPLVLVGLLRDRVVLPEADAAPQEATDEIAAEQLGAAESAVIDGKRVLFEAREEIVLRCGKGSITLRKDGKIVIKGTHLLSRAQGVNRIKGGQVNIN
jgi:hypothetical protein